jgi:hypothetical protein
MLLISSLMAERFNQRANEAVAFFLAQYPIAFCPAVELPERQARALRNAQDLARAEALARAEGCTFEWSVDPHFDSSEWSDETPAWQVWDCVMRDEQGNVVESLGGIDFGRDGEPCGDSYARVVEAELAFQHFAQWYPELLAA